MISIEALGLMAILIPSIIILWVICFDILLKFVKKLK